MDQPLHTLRNAIALSTSAQLSGKSNRFAKLYRRKTADWLDGCFSEILQHLNVKHLVECGAHEASASIRFVKSGGERALAVEANPLTFSSKTKDAARVQGVVVINCGVGPVAGEAEFFIPTSDQMDGSASFLKKEGVEYRTEKVRVQTLDSLYSDNFRDPRPVALWIDVEGLGLQVLRSGQSLLSSLECLAIKIEVESEQFWSEQTLVSQLNDFLLKSGFSPVLRDIEYVGQYNIIYVRSSHVELLDEVILNAWIKLRDVRLTFSERLHVFSKDLAKRFGRFGKRSKMQRKIHG